MNRLRRAAATRKDATNGLLIEMGSLLEIGHYFDYPAPFGHVAHQFGRPDVQLVIRLLLKSCSVLGCIGRQARRAHKVLPMRVGQVSQTAERDRLARWPEPASAHRWALRLRSRTPSLATLRLAVPPAASTHRASH